MKENKFKTEIDLHAVLRLAYGAVVLGLTVVLALKELWPYTVFEQFHADIHGMYPSKLVFMETFLVVLAALYPIFWLVKKILPETFEKDDE